MTDTEKYFALKTLILANAKAYRKGLKYLPGNEAEIGLSFAYSSLAAFIEQMEAKPVAPAPLTIDDEMALHELNERDENP